MKRPKPGDSYHAPEAGSDVVITYIGKHRTIGQMIDVGVLPETHDGDDTKIRHLFYIGFPVSLAIKDGYLSFRGRIQNYGAAKDCSLRFPNFRIGTHEIASWTISHADGSEILKKIDESHEGLPLAYIVNIELLNELIRKRWDGRTVIR